MVPRKVLSAVDVRRVASDLRSGATIRVMVAQGLVAPRPQPAVGFRPSGMVDFDDELRLCSYETEPLKTTIDRFRASDPARRARNAERHAGGERAA
jgi:hypothetical protein